MLFKLLYGSLAVYFYVFQTIAANESAGMGISITTYYSFTTHALLTSLLC